MKNPGRQTACGFALLMLTLMLVGCESYALRGRVIPGTHSQVLVVDSDDPRLAGDGTTPGTRPGVNGATVSFMLDPEKAGHKYLGSTSSDVDGTFSFPVDEIGAGFLEYGLQVTARANNCAPAVDVMRMPPSGKRLLILLAPGHDTLPKESTDPMDDINRYMPR